MCKEYGLVCGSATERVPKGNTSWIATDCIRHFDRSVVIFFFLPNCILRTLWLLPTHIALDAYSLMYDAACTLTDPTTNSYCFLNAAHNSNPSDLYLYQLPIGSAYPNSSTPTCSSCSKSLL